MSILGLGFDATDIPRAGLFRFGERFLHRVITDGEAYYARHRDPVRPGRPLRRQGSR